MSPDARPTLVLVGASGYLGRCLAALACADYHVVATYHSHPPARSPSDADGAGNAGNGSGAEWQALDVRDGAAIDMCMAAARPRLVVNCAYVQHGPDVDAITARAPGIMAAAAQREGAQFVHLSSDVVFPGRDDRAYREDDEPAPVHDYGRAKLRAEQLVTEAHDAPLIIRTSLIYGGAVEGPQERMVRAALGGDDIWFFTDEVRNPIKVDDLASAILELAAGAHHGLLHVAGADAVDRLAFARLLAGAMQASPDRLRGRPRDPAAGPRPGNLALDCSKARAILTTTLTGARAALGGHD